MMSLENVLALGIAAIGIVGGRFLDNGRKAQTEKDTMPETPCPRCESCPLSSLGVGDAGCLLRIVAGRRLRRRLAELGLTPGVEMTVLQNAGGPVLVCVRNSRLALGREMAHKLDVMPVPVEVGGS